MPGLPRHHDLWWDVPFNTVQPEPGVYAISVSNLWEIPLQDEKYVFPWFREREADDRVGFSILICFLASLYPAWRASRLDPVDGLRYE